MRPASLTRFGLVLGLGLALVTPARADDDGLAPPAIATAAPSTPAIDTGFDPELDGLSSTNVGSYDTNGGDCFGYSLEALTRFQARKAGQPTPTGDDEIAQRALAGLVQNRYEIEWKNGLGSKVTTRPLTDASTGRQLLAQLATGTPAILDLQGDGAGHAVVAYAYENGNVLYYDPNFPGVARTWAFDPKTGFAPLSLTLDDKPLPVLSVGVYPPAALAAAPSLADPGALRASCDDLDATCSAIYRTVQADARVWVIDSTSVAWVFSGTVSGGLDQDPEGRVSKPATQLRVYVNGVAVANGKLDAAGHFEIPVYDFPKTGTSTVRIAIFTDGSQLSGFAQATEVARPVAHAAGFAMSSGAARTGLSQAVAAPGR